MPAITSFIDDRAVARSDVQRWEAGRAKAVLRKFVSRLGTRAIAEIAPDVNIDTVLTADLDTQRAALVTLKTGLGHAGIYAMLRRDLATSEKISRVAVAASRGRVARSVIRVIAPGCSAAAFADWFNNLVVVNDEVNMIDAMPDHYLLRGLPDGRQEVVDNRWLTDTDAIPGRLHHDRHALDAGRSRLPHPDRGPGAPRRRFRHRRCPSPATRPRWCAGSPSHRGVSGPHARAIGRRPPLVPRGRIRQLDHRFAIPVGPLTAEWSSVHRLDLAKAVNTSRRQ
ncbi:hypothetical protein [Mycolicibacterium brisbanense]|uniref:hypothetical protein n=1 Tax=Mycolicibacterium brisbanense TaxID=146020 RepID=UPI000A6DF71F|nr:hypothetical protein [Mycolicibacterium brisbanense]